MTRTFSFLRTNKIGSFGWLISKIRLCVLLLLYFYRAMLRRAQLCHSKSSVRSSVCLWRSGISAFEQSLMYTRKPCCSRETIRRRCKIWYVSKFTAASRVLLAIARLSCMLCGHSVTALVQGLGGRLQALFCIHRVNRVYGALIVASWRCYGAL